jgi:hypothetical protein
VEILRVQTIKAENHIWQIENMTKMELIQRLRELTFAQVTNSIFTDEKLFAFKGTDGGTWWDTDPGFMEERRKFSPEAWRANDKSYRFYYGFALAGGISTHFDSIGHSRSRGHDYVGLGFVSDQHELNPPNRGIWIVGSVRQGEKGPHFFNWARCTEAEKNFAALALSGQTTFSPLELDSLRTPPGVSAESDDWLVHMARLLLAMDVGYYLGRRTQVGGQEVDGIVLRICSTYGSLDLWEEYEKSAREQRIPDKLKYSRWIPAPAPKPIHERRDNGDPNPVGLSTPFAGLVLKS